MKTKNLLHATGLTIIIILLITLFTNAQIPIKGLAVDHEGIACWDADGSGPEPEGYGHIHPFGYGSSLYYGASRDYVDANVNAALCHFTENISGFPLFVQALADNGFTSGQVKIKLGLLELKNDIEGEDYFTFNGKHYMNRYDAYYYIELNNEPMISGYINFFNILDVSGISIWESETNFTLPFDASENSSMEVKEVAAAFLTDMDGEELRFVITNSTASGSFSGPGVIDGAYFEINSGYLEKGLPEIPIAGLAVDHEGIAFWDADGTGPEPEADGHTFWYGGTEWWMPYYTASRDYDDIDPDPNAGLCHLIDIGTGFPNLDIQLAYRGFTIDEFTSKTDIATLGNDVQGVDWGLDGNIHWHHTYGNTITFEIGNEPILECVIDTNFNYWNMDDPYGNWWSHTGYVTFKDISANSSEDAQYVAASYLKDIGGHSIKFFSEGSGAPGTINANGRDGVFHEILDATIETKLPAGRLIWENEIKDTLYLDQSPYIFMDYCEVPDGEKLFIEPGVLVKFNSTEFFVINGCIEAEGTEALPILFTAVDPNVPWGGLVWDETPVTNDTSEIKHCIFEYAYGYGEEYGSNCGGAILINQVEKIKISHCIFRYNKADKFTGNNPAGGALGISESSIHISHCVFHDNASSWGGALALFSNSSAVIDNCLFYNNKSTYTGGGGGAVLAWSNCTPHFINSTFAYNHAADAGGAVELELGGETTFTNCIFWGNSADIGANQISIWVEDPPSLNVYYSDVENGLNGIEPGFTGEYIGNIDIDPEFITFGDYLYIPDPSASPCVDTGTLNSLYLPSGWTCPNTCLCGNPRIGGATIDMGCYEALYTGDGESLTLENSALQIFPNPINSNPVIEFYLENNGSVQISILDIHGRIVSEILTQDLQSGKNQVTLNTEKMSSGIYFCRLQIENKVMTKKVVKLN